jgi:hypothetical protein
MLQAQFRDANGVSLNGLRGIDGENLDGFFSSVTSAVSSAFSSVKGAVSTVANAACSALPTASALAAKAPTQYQSGIAKATSTAAGICSKFGPKPKPPAAAPAPAAVPMTVQAIPMQTAQLAPVVVQSKYPAGSVARFNVDRKVWVIYAPAGSIAGLGIFDANLNCVYGDCGGLGQETEEPAPGTKVGEEPTKPAETPDAGKEHDKKPFYKKPLFWVAIAGGVAVVGTGGYFLLRRKAA